MAADHFCLRWNNHQSTLVSVFDDLLESETLVDCTLAADGKYLKAHKVVLSACSPYLGMILSQHYDQHPIIILKDVKYEEMKAMLDYMYRGEVNISQELLATFLKAAESLQIKGLTDTSGLNEEVNKKQQQEIPPSSDESTTSATTIDDIPSREGSCSPSPKKRKQEIYKNNIESDHKVKEVRAGLYGAGSDLSVRNSIASKFKLDGTDMSKNSLYVKSEPIDDISYDGVIPSNIKGSEDDKKGIPRPGPSNGSNSSVVGSPWQMSVDSTGDEMKTEAEQDVDQKKQAGALNSSVMTNKLKPVVRLRVLCPEELGRFVSSCSNKGEDTNNKCNMKQGMLGPSGKDKHLNVSLAHSESMVLGVTDKKPSGVKSPVKHVAKSKVEIIVLDVEDMICDEKSEPIVEEKVKEELVGFTKVKQEPETINLCASPELCNPAPNVPQVLQQDLNNPLRSRTDSSSNLPQVLASRPTDTNSPFTCSAQSVLQSTLFPPSFSPSPSTNTTQNLVQSSNVSLASNKMINEFLKQMPANYRDRISDIKITTDKQNNTLITVTQTVSNNSKDKSKGLPKHRLIKPKLPAELPDQTNTMFSSMQPVSMHEPAVVQQTISNLITPSSQSVSSPTQSITQPMYDKFSLQPLCGNTVQSAPQPIVCPQYMVPLLASNNEIHNTANCIATQQINQNLNQQVVILNPNQPYLNKMQPIYVIRQTEQ